MNTSLEPVFYDSRQIPDEQPDALPNEDDRPTAAASRSRPEAAVPTVLERREWRWRTWHVVAVCGASVLIGILLGNVSRSSGGGVASSTAPKSAGARADETIRVPTSAAGRESATRAPSTVAAAGAAPPRPAGVLLDLKRESGPMTTEHFVVGGGRWTLGWAYDCTGKSGEGSFQVTIYNPDGLPSADGGVNQRGSKGSSIAAYTSTGERYLGVQTNCIWAIRVTA